MNLNIKTFLFVLMTVGILVYFEVYSKNNLLIKNNLNMIAERVSNFMLMNKQQQQPKNITTNMRQPLDFYDVIATDLDRNESLILEMDHMTLNATFPLEYVDTNPIYKSHGPKLKKILFWNDIYRKKHFGFGYGQEPFIAAGCKIDTCFTTSNRYLFDLNEVDAIIWNFRSLDKSLPKIRSNHTRYVFWMGESAVHLFGNLKQFNGVFNWTMTYRLDSDTQRLYGLLRSMKHENENYNPEINYLANKTKMAAWFVSHCRTPSKREIYVEELSKYLPVDIYGGCGPLNCSRKTNDKCLKMLEKDYKFYLSFENSLCLDYITEKFFNILEYNVIPVVYGLGQYDKVAPPHSYINALDFNSPKELADYLIYLDNNPDKYNEYFLWKQYYVNIGGWAVRARTFCTLCEKLHDVTAPNHVYTDLYEWFVTNSKCRTGSANYSIS